MLDFMYTPPFFFFFLLLLIMFFYISLSGILSLKNFLFSSGVLMVVLSCCMEDQKGQK